MPEVSPLVANLVKTDGTAYLVTCQRNKCNPSKSIPGYIEATDIRWDPKESHRKFTGFPGAGA